MQQSSRQQSLPHKEHGTNLSTKLSFDVEKYPPIELTRKFSAPVERLWDAWTTSELLMQWWGPETYSCPDARLDVRVGGKSILAMKDPEGKVVYSGGVYEEVIPNQRLVTSDYFMDKDGNRKSANELGLPGQWLDTMKLTIEFERLGANESQLKIFHEGIAKDMHDDCISGWSTSLDKLQRLIEKNH